MPAVDLRFAITPGMRQVLGEIAVTGNRAIDTDVIVRTLGLTVNAPLRVEESLQARRRIFDTGLFRRADIAVEPLGPSTDGRTIPMRMRVTVEEWPALRLRYGVQAAEERPPGQIEGRDLVPGLSADLTRRTLFGRAITTGGAITWQQRERMGRLFTTAPTLFGWPIESSLVLDRSREDFAGDTLVTDVMGVSWEQRTRLAGSLTLVYAYRFERNHTFDTKVALDPNEILFDIAVNIARITGSAAWDTRDNPADPTRGSLLSSSLELAPEMAGSDIRFIRQVSQAYYFRPWRGAVLASAARIGMVRPLGGQELIPSERFFAGGPGTVRGVALDSLGARDFFGDPAGGQAMAVFNEEARVPIYKWLRGVGFMDAGNIFPQAGDLRLRDLVGSVGVGLRLATPFALLRVDFAKPLWAGPAERSGRWSFGIGHAF
jgi:outer membrane protein assembly factor BamA